MKTKTKLMIAAGAATGWLPAITACELAYNRFIRRGPKFFAMGPQEDALTEEQRAERRQRQEAVQSWFAASQVQDLTRGLLLRRTAAARNPDSQPFRQRQMDRDGAWLRRGQSGAFAEAKTFDKPALTILCRICAGTGLSGGLCRHRLETKPARSDRLDGPSSPASIRPARSSCSVCQWARPR